MTEALYFYSVVAACVAAVCFFAGGICLATANDYAPGSRNRRTEAQLAWTWFRRIRFAPIWPLVVLVAIAWLPVLARRWADPTKEDKR